MAKRIISAFALALGLIACVCCSRRDKDAIIVDLGDVPTQMQDSLEAWKSAHPDVKIQQRRRVQEKDVRSLAVLGADHMPDVFITDGLTGRLLSRMGRLQSLDGFVGALPGLGFSGSAWAFPARREAITLVVFDKNTTDEPGFLSETDLLAGFLSDSLGQTWLQHMVAGDREAAFTDRFFVERLSLVQERALTGGCMTVDDFVTGKCTSILVGGENMYALLERIKEQDPERYNRLQFRPFMGDAILRGYDYGIFISASTVINPDTLLNCLSLCEALTPQEETDPKDETLRRLHELLDSAPHAAIPTQFFSFQFWDRARSNCFSRLSSTGYRNLSEHTAYLQNAYEQEYLSSL